MLRMVADLRLVYRNSTKRYLSKGFSMLRMMRAIYKYESSWRYGYVVDLDDISSFPDRKLYMLMWATPIVDDTIALHGEELNASGDMPYPRPFTPEGDSPEFHSDLYATMNDPSKCVWSQAPENHLSAPAEVKGKE